MVSGRLSVTTPGTSMKQRWSVVSWGMDMPYWRYRELLLDRDPAGHLGGPGSALEMSPAWPIASEVGATAPTLMMCQ